MTRWTETGGVFFSPRYVVCEYYPRGNVVGYFAQNVQAPVKSSSGHIQGTISLASRVEGLGSTMAMVVLSTLVFAVFLP